MAARARAYRGAHKKRARGRPVNGDVMGDKWKSEVEWREWAEIWRGVFWESGCHVSTSGCHVSTSGCHDSNRGATSAIKGFKMRVVEYLRTSLLSIIFCGFDFWYWFTLRIVELSLILFVYGKVAMWHKFFLLGFVNYLYFLRVRLWTNIEYPYPDFF